MLGEADGESLGESDGIIFGRVEGDLLGGNDEGESLVCNNGRLLGTFEGKFEEATVEKTVERFDGATLGNSDGV